MQTPAGTCSSCRPARRLPGTTGNMPLIEIATAPSKAPAARAATLRWLLPQLTQRWAISPYIELQGHRKGGRSPTTFPPPCIAPRRSGCCRARAGSKGQLISSVVPNIQRGSARMRSRTAIPQFSSWRGHEASYERACWPLHERFTGFFAGAARCRVLPPAQTGVWLLEREDTGRRRGTPLARDKRRVVG